tara:strand:+ start:305 stop:703 length:399 start_codon:yes stop_codon:yes gene_type:complete
MAYIVNIQVNTGGGGLNESLQVGDTVYYSHLRPNQVGGRNAGGARDSKPKILGKVDTINRANGSLMVDCGNVIPFTINLILDRSDMYLFFSKDRTVNYSGVVGYFMEVEYRNYTTLKSEIFATAVDYADSSR